MTTQFKIHVNKKSGDFAATLLKWSGVLFFLFYALRLAANSKSTTLTENYGVVLESKETKYFVRFVFKNSKTENCLIIYEQFPIKKLATSSNPYIGKNITNEIN